MIPEEDGAEKGETYNPRRGAKVVAYTEEFLDKVVALKRGSFSDVSRFFLKRVGRKKRLDVILDIDPETIGPWAERNGKVNDLSILVDDKDLIAEIQSAVDDANSAVSKAEGIKKFAILPDDWTQEKGELSLKLSLRRHIVMKNHEADVEALYKK